MYSGVTNGRDVKLRISPFLPMKTLANAEAEVKRAECS